MRAILLALVLILASCGGQKPPSQPDPSPPRVLGCPYGHKGLEAGPGRECILR